MIVTLGACLLGGLVVFNFEKCHVLGKDMCWLYHFQCKTKQYVYLACQCMLITSVSQGFALKAIILALFPGNVPGHLDSHKCHCRQTDTWKRQKWVSNWARFRNILKLSSQNHWFGFGKHSTIFWKDLKYLETPSKPVKSPEPTPKQLKSPKPQHQPCCTLWIWGKTLQHEERPVNYSITKLIRWEFWESGTAAPGELYCWLTSLDPFLITSQAQWSSLLVVHQHRGVICLAKTWDVWSQLTGCQHHLRQAQVLGLGGVSLSLNQA